MGVLQRQRDLTRLQSKATELEASNTQLVQQLEQQEATMSEQLANLQDRAQQVRWPACKSLARPNHVGHQQTSCVFLMMMHCCIPDTEQPDRINVMMHPIWYGC